MDTKGYIGIDLNVHVHIYISLRPAPSQISVVCRTNWWSISSKDYEIPYKNIIMRGQRCRLIRCFTSLVTFGDVLHSHNYCFCLQGLEVDINSGPKSLNTYHISICP